MRRRRAAARLHRKPLQRQVDSAESRSAGPNPLHEWSEVVHHEERHREAAHCRVKEAADRHRKQQQIQERMRSARRSASPVGQIRRQGRDRARRAPTSCAIASKKITIPFVL